MDVVLAGSGSNGQGVLHGGRQRLFYHGRNAVARRRLDDLAMVENGGVDEHGVRLLLRQHRFQIVVEERCRELEARRILRGQRLIGLYDGDQLGVRIAGKRTQEATDMPMHQAHDGDAHRSGWRLRVEAERGQQETYEEQGPDSHGVLIQGAGCNIPAWRSKPIWSPLSDGKKR